MTQTELLKEAARLLSAGYAADAKRLLETELPEALQEAGRVLSAKNEARLRAAVKELGDALAELTPKEAEAVASEVAPTVEALHEVTPINGAEFFREAQGSKKPPLLKLIAADTWGEYGYYSSDVLKRDGAAAFPRGSFNLWDHMTEAEKQARPEGSIDDIASVTTDDARFMADGADGPGLYAPVKVFSDYAEKVQEKGPHIGVSINAYGVRKPGRVGNREGMLIERLLPHKLNTADYVTRAGAGGAVLLQESAKPQQATTPEAVPVSTSEPIQEAHSMPMDDREIEALRESVNNLKAKFETQESKLGELTAENNQLRQHQQLREAKDFALARLRKVDGLPSLLHERLAESVASNPPIRDGKVNTEVLEPLVEAAARREMALLSQLGLAGGRVHGLGGSPADEPDPAKLKESIQRRFQNIGLSETASKYAVAGRKGGR